MKNGKTEASIGTLRPENDRRVSALPLEVTKDRQVEAMASQAFNELMEDSRKNGTIVTPILLKRVLEKRIQEFLGAGALMPKVEVGLRRDGTGFDVSIRPGDLPPGLFVKKTP